MSFDMRYIIEVLDFLGHLRAGGVTEIRIFPKERYMKLFGKSVYVGKVVSGYYDNYDKLARDIRPFDGKANIYVTLNAVKRDLLARAFNRLQYSAQATTGDTDILCDMWLPIDADPVRPAGISSTDAELQLALQKRDEVADFLSPWAQVVKGMSGNGGHGLIRLPGYPNTIETRRAKERLIRFLADRFSDSSVSVDNTVFNMSRIWKLYGTVACKGDSIPSRPYRRSYLELKPVQPCDLYLHIDDIIPPDYGSQRDRMSDFNGDYPLLDVIAYLNAWGGKWRMRVKDGVRWYQFMICPLHTDYDGHQWECGICQYPGGRMGAKCMHDPSYGWQEFKAVLGDPREFYSSPSV